MYGLRHVPGADEVIQAMRANKSQDEILRIFLRYPRLVASFIVSRDPFYARWNIIATFGKIYTQPLLPLSRAFLLLFC